MDWKNHFRKMILDRGLSYYKSGKVRQLTHSGEEYRAKVVGSSIYQVTIKMQKGEPASMECTCPYAESGDYCKHMAAVLYAIEAKKPEDEKKKTVAKKSATVKKPEPDVPIRPFSRTTEYYQYYDMGRMTEELEFSSQTLAKARKLLQEKKVELDQVHMGYFQTFRGTIAGGMAYGRAHTAKGAIQLTVFFDRTRIIRTTCGVAGCGNYYDSSLYYSDHSICCHSLALMLLLDQYLKKYNPGDATDQQGEAFLDNFRYQHMQLSLSQTAEQTADFELEPVLEKEKNGFYAAFKAGTTKLYVVKDLPELVNTYEGRGEIHFGTKTEIDLSTHRISDSSRDMYEFLRDIIRSEKARKQYNELSYYYSDSADIKKRIALYGDRLDRFFELCEGKTIACSDKSGRRMEKKEIPFREGKPGIHLKVEKDVDEENIFHGVRVTGKLPDLIQGNDHSYYFKNNVFYRVNEELKQELQPLLELGEYGDIDFTVGRRYLSEFYHQYLPALKRNARVQEVEPEVIREYIPPEAVFAFYLDAENGRIFCRPKARYGEQSVSLLDNCREDWVYESFRDLNREEEMLRFVSRYFQETDLDRDELYCEASEEAVLRLLDGGVERLMALGEVHTTDRFRNINIRRMPRIKIGVSMESDLMNLTVTSEEMDPEELLEILQSYQKKKKYYRLKSGDLVSMEEADAEMLHEMLETLQLSPKDLRKGKAGIPAYRALYLNKMLERSEHVQVSRDRYFRKLIKEFKTVEDSDFEVPESLASVMRNYQIEGFKWLKTLEHYNFGGILADEMGLGKTLQMIAVLLSAKESGETGTALIVCPASLVYNWFEEFARFAPALQVTLVVGSQAERAALIQGCQGSDVLVTSYDLLKRDIAEYKDVEFAYQVLDEAQYIKNHGTAAAKSVKRIKSRHRFALTGTPIENRLSELWSIFDYLMPGFLYGYETFRKKLETPIVKQKDEDASERLKRMVAPFILRRRKEQVLKDLPDKIEEIRYARLGSEQQKLYDGQVVHMRSLIGRQNTEDFQKNKLQILAELTRIRQICCDPELLFENYRGESAKREACMDLIASAIEGEHKILVFSQFTSMLELLEIDLKKAEIGYYKITGATPKEKRVEMVSAFNEDDTPVFLISLKAGGTGLNLTGADVVIHYDPWWNQAAQNQATDRAHRIGQTRVVSVYKLIMKDTIEEKIVKLQESKRELADTILSGEMGGITQMSREEILELLEN